MPNLSFGSLYLVVVIGARIGGSFVRGFWKPPFCISQHVFCWFSRFLGSKCGRLGEGPLGPHHPRLDREGKFPLRSAPGQMVDIVENRAELRLGDLAAGSKAWIETPDRLINAILDVLEEAS